VTDWNIADVWEAVAGAKPGADALVQGRRRTSWADFDRRADGVAAALLDAGLGHQAKVAQYLYNCPEYVEAVFACFKAGLVPVNTNYRYGEDELAYLWDNADVEAVVFHGSLTEMCERLRRRRPPIRSWLWVDDGNGSCPSWAERYEDAAEASTAAHLAGPWGRSGDDLYFVYTGGTTGMPKGVMWRQDDLFCILNTTAEVRYPEGGSAADIPGIVNGPLRYPEARLVPCPPLMHGSGTMPGFSALNGGGCLVLLEGRSFSAAELLDTIVSERVTEMTIVGDAFARPILRELDGSPGRWDLISLWLVISAGAMFSADVKEGLLVHLPGALLLDNLGSSEALGVARSRTTAGRSTETATFHMGADTMVIREDGTPVVRGSGEVGMVALRGRNPVGYYKDPEKTARTFRMIGGERWAVNGDYASVEADGSIRFAGRGSVCINTGGEKVFPEEVEEVLKLHPCVEDAVVVGIPDERFGETVAAVIEPREGTGDLDVASVVAHVRGRLAGYKVPREVVAVASVGRSPAGKVDYAMVRELVLARHR